MSDTKTQTVKRATPEELQAKIADLQAQGDALSAKVADGSATPDEVNQLADINSQIEAAQQELAGAGEAQRFAVNKARMQEAAKPAPKLPATVKRTDAQPDGREALRLWFASQFPKARLTYDEMHRMAEFGFYPGSSRVEIPFNWNNVNHKRRTKLSTTGSGTGTEFTYKTYSDKLTEFISYHSPIVGVFASETLDNGNSREYKKVDATGLKSTKTSASSGTEINPTIPDVNVTTAKVTLKTITYTSGYQKITWEETQDSSVNLFDRMAGWNSESHARAIEEAAFTGAGSGSDGSFQGLLTVANDLTPVAAGSFGADDVEAMYFKIPAQYRQNAVFACNDDMAAFLRQTMKDGVERSLFDKNIVDGVEWDTFLGKKFYVSNYITDDTLLYFVPDYYQLLFGGGEEFATFDEKFWPDKAVAGLIRVTGGWLGPTGSTGAVHSLAITS